MLDRGLAVPVGREECTILTCCRRRGRQCRAQQVRQDTFGGPKKQYLVGEGSPIRAGQDMAAHHGCPKQGWLGLHSILPATPEMLGTYITTCKILAALGGWLCRAHLAACRGSVGAASLAPGQRAAQRAAAAAHKAAEPLLGSLPAACGALEIAATPGPPTWQHLAGEAAARTAPAGSMPM